MKFGIVVSKKDEAGMNTAEHLDKLGRSYVIAENETIYEDNLEQKEELVNCDFVIFATKHESEKEVKTLSVHAPGNWRKAEFGGKEGEVCLTSCLFLKHLFKILNEERQKAGIEDYTVSMEATHHGPVIEKPCCFIEIGSTIKQWKDKKAGELIARVIKRAIKEKPERFEAAIGIGGPHYCPNFNKIQLNTNYAIGHIIPEYAFPLTEEMLKQAIEKTIEKPKTAILDWKGCGISGQRQKIAELLEKNKIKVLRSDKLRY